MSIAVFGAIAYGIASAAFLLLTLLLITSWQGRAQGARLVVASGATTLWAALLAYDSWVQSMPVAAIALAEFLRDGAWLLVLTGLTRLPGLWATLSRVTLLFAGSAIALAAAGLLIGPFAAAGYSALALLMLGGLILSLVAMVLLEQVYRNANAAGRHALKFLVIGVGGLFAYDLFLYSQAQLLKAIEPASWAARGLVVALTVPMIALAARHNPQWSLKVFVSRQVVFYTTSFLVIGAYLLVMSAGGYVIRLYGGTWGRVAQLVFFAGAGMVLFVLMTSASLRRRLRVFLSKHFYRNKYDYRIEWLRFIDTLSRRDVDADVHGNAVRSIAQIIGSPGGALYLNGEADVGFVAAAAWPAHEFSVSSFPPIAGDEDLPQFLRRKQWVVDLREFERSPDVYQNITLPSFDAAQGRLRIIVPLVLEEILLGFVVLADPPPPFETTYEDRDLLKTVGRDVAMHLAQHEADRQLAESRQFEAYHRLTAFVMHDLKNLAAQLSMIVSNADKHRRNPEFVDDAISTIAHSAARMQRLIEQLQGREAQTPIRRISLLDIAREACSRCAVRQPVPTCGTLDPEAVVHADPERLGMMVEHLIRNAQDATADSGVVRIEVALERNVEVDSTGSSGVFPVLQADRGVPVMPNPSQPGVPEPVGQRLDFACLTVSDSGAGMTAEFIRERLFRPFDSTKGSKGMGIGAYQVREYVHALGGRIRVRSAPGQGTTVTLRLPACP
jgi:putative PEP-CTERM system histidine kinase